MFVDEVRICVQGGAGGSGCSSFLREKWIPRGGPDGGDGGRGGHVILEATRGMSTLAYFSAHRHFKAQRGDNGGSKMKSGARGQDSVVRVPVGTLVKDEQGLVMADLVLEGEQAVVGHGGRGGRGNAALKSRANPLPRFAEKGEPGRETWIVLELRLLADVGIVGLPNAGKSTLLTRVSAARPKIADYPFTTLEPHLGVVVADNAFSCVWVDLPGLIEGAHQGKGLGDKFLRHVERTRLILHLVDASGQSGRDPAQDYADIRSELEAYSPRLAAKPELVVLGKMDLPDARERAAAIQKQIGRKTLRISAATGDGVDALVKAVAKELRRLPAHIVREEPVHRFALEPDFEISRAADGTFDVKGKRVERLVIQTNLDNEEAVGVLQRKLERMGLEKELEEAGVADGDTVRIGRFEFVYTQE